MPLDSDIALFGTGVASLIAANHLVALGKSVLLLNPDWDFFLEDSELPLDPLLQGRPRPERLNLSSPEQALATLRPDFPGAIEFWSPNSTPSGFHDLAAPHVRQRNRLWISAPEKDRLWKWENLEDLFVEASDADLKPQILEGISAAHRFPGYSSHLGNFRGLLIPKLCDVDVVRYRNGLLEFIRERLGPERVVSAVNQLEIMPEGIRFHAKGSLNTAKLKHGMLVFWTPRLSSWIMNQGKLAEIVPERPRGVRLWEQWSLQSRESIDPNTVGMFGDMTVWADFEGSPPNQDSQVNGLAVLRAGPLIELENLQLPKGGLSWASAESFSALSSLGYGFLKWDRLTIRALKTRAIFEWENPSPWTLSKNDPKIRVIPGCDGPLIEVVRTSRQACESLLGESP